MPNVNIWEKDLTSSGQLEFDNFVVLLPGICYTDLWKEDVTIEPILVSNGSSSKEAISFDKFNKIILANAEASGIDEDHVKALEESYSYNALRKFVVDLGMTVYYAPIKNDDGTALDTDGNLVIPDKFFDQFADRGLYDIRFILTGGDLSVNTAMAAIKCAATRADAIALLDIPEEESGVEILDAEAIRKYINENFTQLIVERTNTAKEKHIENAYAYAASFAPRFTYNEGKKVFEELGSFAYLAAFSKHIHKFPEWFAMAGSIRGVLPYDNVTPVISFGDYDVNNYLTTRNGLEKACNPIRLVRPYGNILDGNRTMFYTFNDEIDQFGTGLRASHFLNIRNLCCTLKKVIYRACRRFTFEPNTDVLWVNFCEAIRPTLELMKSTQGIRGYKFEREDTDIKALVKAKIIIKPIEAVEDFDITIELSDSVDIYE